MVVCLWSRKNQRVGVKKHASTAAALATGQALRGHRKFVLSILRCVKSLDLRRVLVSTFRANREVNRSFGTIYRQSFFSRVCGPCPAQPKPHSPHFAQFILTVISRLGLQRATPKTVSSV